MVLSAIWPGTNPAPVPFPNCKTVEILLSEEDELLLVEPPELLDVLELLELPIIRPLGDGSVEPPQPDNNTQGRMASSRYFMSAFSPAGQGRYVRCVAIRAPLTQ